MHRNVGMLVTVIALGLAACASEADPAPDANAAPEANAAAETSNRVVTSGKEAVPLDQVPAAVLAAARAARAGFVPAEAERETRDGRHYFDIEGRLADGSEIEFDIMQEGDGWRVVETQRDIAFAAAPAPVQAVAARHDAAFAPNRVIESVQNDGLVIYELYGPAGTDPRGRKVEIKWDGHSAEVLQQEWEH